MPLHLCVNTNTTTLQPLLFYLIKLYQVWIYLAWTAEHRVLAFALFALLTAERGAVAVRTRHTQSKLCCQLPIAFHANTRTKFARNLSIILYHTTNFTARMTDAGIRYILHSATSILRVTNICVNTLLPPLLLVLVNISDDRAVDGGNFPAVVVVTYIVETRPFAVHLSPITCVLSYSGNTSYQVYAYY